MTEVAVRERIVAYLESLGYETLHFSSGYSNHLHSDADLGRVDFIYVDDDTSRRLFAPGAPSLTLLHTITVGVTAKGMLAWEPVIGPERVRQVAAYVVTQNAQALGRPLPGEDEEPRPKEGGERP